MAALAPIGVLQTPIDALAALWVWLCFAAVASLLIFIFVALWLYRDAESRGMGGLLWVLVLVAAGFLFPFVGGLVVLVIYVVVRMEHPVGAVPAVAAPVPPPPPPGPEPPTGTPASCKTCGAPARPGAAFCANCGAKL